MKDYDRLTQRTKSGDYELKLNAINFSAVQRLGSLEDRIEDGTLVKVPYAIGQRIYCMEKSSTNVEIVKVSLITIRHDGDIDLRLNHYRYDGTYFGCFKYNPKYYELFETEAEVFKRLEEVKQRT